MHFDFAGIFQFYQLLLLITSRLKFKTNLQNLTFKDNKFGGSDTRESVGCRSAGLLADTYRHVVGGGNDYCLRLAVN